MTTFDLQGIPPRDDDGRLRAVIETPAGCRNKYKYDPALRLFTLDKVLPAGAAFPYDFGFVPRTLGEDGDPLDVLVLADEPTFTGCVVGVRLLGVIEATQTEDGETDRNDRLIGLVDTDRNPAEARSLRELPGTLLDEIEHFFVSYNRYEGRRFMARARHGPRVAEKLIRAGTREYERRHEARNGAVNGAGKASRHERAGAHR